MRKAKSTLTKIPAIAHGQFCPALVTQWQAVAAGATKRQTLRCPLASLSGRCLPVEEVGGRGVRRMGWHPVKNWGVHQTWSAMALVCGLRANYSNYQLGTLYHLVVVEHSSQKKKKKHVLETSKGKTEGLPQNSRSLDTGIFFWI